MQFHPFSSVSSFVCCSGKGGVGVGGGSNNDENKKYNTKGSSCLINLEGGGLVDKSNFVVFGQEEEEGGNNLFTDAQFQELYLQVVIFKYLSSGLSVPFHLLLRIWSDSSFAISSSCSGFSSPLFIHRKRRTTMDLEPGRCRRTDGKKWRCYGNVVPDQKYCERHMHRGSHRSRKLVETASKNILKSNINQEYVHLSDKKSRSSSSSSSIFNSRTSSVPNGGISVPVSTTLDLTPPSATIAEYSSSSSTAIISSLLKGQNNNSTRNARNWNDLSRNNNSGKSSCVVAGFGVSPKSVLQGGSDAGYRNTGTQNESLRCRRTDGKRWRCSKMVVPCKKYCENHLHRGSKKAATTMATKTVAGGSCCVQKKKKKKKKAEMVSNYRRKLDTNLSMSIVPNNPKQKFDNDSSSRSSSSDATTVSDENVCRLRTL